MARGKRAYTSPLREQQAEATRVQILEGAIQVLAGGAAALTIPAVAKESGVAVPTVYRYFGSKEELEDGVADHVRTQAGVRTAQPGSLDEMLERVRVTWGAMGDQPRPHLALLMASVGRELLAEREGRDRRQFAEIALADALDGVRPDLADRVKTIATALASSPGGVAFLRIGVDLDEAAELYAFIVRAVIADARRASGLDGDGLTGR